MPFRSFPRRPKNDAPRSQALFGGRRESPPEGYLIAHIDGGSRGNPGPAGYGVVLQDEAGHTVAKLSEFLGWQTNNFAEYSGLLAALRYALEHGKAVKVLSDSELLVRQIQGQYKVSSPGLQELYREARKLIDQLDWFRIEHVYREQNREADRLANEAMDKGTARREQPATAKRAPHEVNGIVRDGVVEFLGEPFPDGVRVSIRKVE